jgi:LuxR family maltose regulon positive regulatory protein
VDGEVLAATKLQVPHLRTGLVVREELLERLAGADARLTLVSAPAGSGKTTLVAQWATWAGEARSFAWLSLDPEDADPVRFWGCVIGALRTAHPGFGAEALAALRAGAAAIGGAVVPLIINEALTLPRPTVLVLDDLHALGDEADDVYRTLAALLDRLPDTLQLAVTTRSEPPLPVPRLRARGLLAEIRAGDLRFTDDDAAALLRRGFGVELDPDAVARLQERTEGWAAGLQLAGVSLGRRGADFDAFMQAFAEPHGDVLAYLAEEVLEAQPPALRDFLLRTSILERMSAELCDAVTGRADADASLAELERRNLLIVALDPASHWWRYHQLFAELLRRRLEREAPPEEVAALHRRAAAWHREHGAAQDAVRHALASGDAALAADLVARHWEAVFNRGELTVVAGWLAALPEGALQREPRLWLARLWTAMDRGRLEDAERQLAGAEDDATPEVRAWGLLLHALHAFKRGDVGAAAAGLDEATARPPDDFARTVAAHLRGLEAFWHGHPRLAQRHFAQAAELADGNHNRLGVAYAVGYLALIAAEARDDEATQRHLAHLEELQNEDPAVAEHFVAFAGALAEGRMLELAGAYEGAVAPLRRAIELTQRGAGRLEQAEALLRLAAVQRARGRGAEAAGLDAEAQLLLEGCRDRGRLASVARAAAGRRPAAALAREDLTPSELAVLRLLPTELSQREIGAELFLSINTVKTHCRNIYLKLGTGSREDAVVRARELGLL